MDGFYVQGIAGDLAWVSKGTPFDIQVSGDEYIVGAPTSRGSGETYILYRGSEAECRAYLAQLPAMLSRAGVPVVFTQGDPRRPPADPDDTVRWGT